MWLSSILQVIKVIGKLSRIAVWFTYPQILEKGDPNGDGLVRDPWFTDVESA
jgi:hypothetical protein